MSSDLLIVVSRLPLGEIQKLKPDIILARVAKQFRCVLMTKSLEIDERNSQSMRNNLDFSAS